MSSTQKSSPVQGMEDQWNNGLATHREENCVEAGRAMREAVLIAPLCQFQEQNKIRAYAETLHQNDIGQCRLNTHKRFAGN